MDCLHTAPLCTFCMQDCNSAIEHGGGPADKMKLNLAMNRVKRLTASSHVKRRHGVGAVGYAVVQPDQRVPDCDFFEPQRMFRVRFRFASFTIAAYLVHRALPRVASQSFFLLRITVVFILVAMDYILLRLDVFWRLYSYRTSKALYSTYSATPPPPRWPIPRD